MLETETAWVELLGDRNVVVADDRCAPLLLDQHRLGTWSQRYPNGIRQLGRTAKYLSLAAERNSTCVWAMPKDSCSARG
jgi:hypothetical protein